MSEVVGGLRWPGFAYATWPLIALSASSASLTFSMRLGLGRFAGPWQIARASVTRVDLARGVLRPRAVRIATSDGDEWLFTPMRTSGSAVLESLEALAYPVER